MRLATTRSTESGIVAPPATVTASSLANSGLPLAWCTMRSRSCEAIASSPIEPTTSSRTSSASSGVSSITLAPSNPVPSGRRVATISQGVVAASLTNACSSEREASSNQ